MLHDICVTRTVRHSRPLVSLQIDPVRVTLHIFIMTGFVGEIILREKAVLNNHGVEQVCMFEII